MFSVEGTEEWPYRPWLTPAGLLRCPHSLIWMNGPQRQTPSVERSQELWRNLRQRVQKTLDYQTSERTDALEVNEFKRGRQSLLYTVWEMKALQWFSQERPTKIHLVGYGFLWSSKKFLMLHYRLIRSACRNKVILWDWDLNLFGTFHFYDVLFFKNVCAVLVYLLSSYLLIF